MNLKNKIIPKSDFQYSVNIDFDINSNEKIKGYIPTVGGLNIIEDVMLSTIPNSKERARIFVGAYGKGKSHLVLTILSLLNKKDKSLFTNILNKAKEINIDFYNFINNYLESDKKLLPVVIQGSSSDTTQTFLLSLKNALEMNGLTNILPDSYFSCAIDTINTWKEQYKATYITFTQLIEEDVEVFINKLNAYDNDTYQKFIKLFPQLTSGSEFVPTKGLDIVRVYEDVSKKVKQYGYNGLFVVYDEFSKFLENSIGKTSAMEIKMIQDFAELCNRSGENQLHLLLISHKHIQNYISQLPKEKVDAWKAVAERFKTVEIHNNFTQTYEIISTVIQKDKHWFDNYIIEHKNDFTILQDCMERIGVFNDLPENVANDLKYSCYPLDTASLFILPRISELVAQNERTIFTFLASNQKHSLTDFINNNEDDFNLITPDYIYDYFEQLFRNENYNSKTFTIWNNCKNAILKLENKTNNELAYKILKSIAIINILQQQDTRLTPTIDTLQMIYLPKYKNIDVINEAIKELKVNGAISLMDYNNHININKGTEVDLMKAIEDNMLRVKNIFSPKDELNNVISKRYLYPTRYNDEYAITRFFKVEFINDDEILEVENWNKKIQNIEADGIVYLVLENGNVSRNELKTKLQQVNNERIVFVRLNKQNTINKTLLKLKALEMIEVNAKENEKNLIKEELSVYYEDCIRIINEFVDSYLRPELQLASYINNGTELKKIKRKSSVSQLLSEICENVFVHTPKINNELVNKNEISTPLVNARRIVIKGLLQNTIKPNLDIVGNGPENNVMRSTLFAFGILEQDKNILKIDNIKNENIQIVLNIIKQFIISSGENAKSFADLYEQLISPEYHIGLKKGVIPIYIASVLNLYKQHIVIMNMNGKEVEVKAETLENINKVPENYMLVLEDWNDEKQSYINELDELFTKYIVDSEREYNTFDYVVKAMQRWFLQLPKYTKETEQIYKGNNEFDKLDIKAKKVRSQLRNSELNSRELLFDKIPEIYGKPLGKLLYNSLKHTIMNFDDMLTNLIDCLASDIKRIFNGKPNSTIVSTLKDWSETIGDYAKSNLYDNRNEIIFELIDNASNDDIDLIFKISRHLTGLRITDWEDSSITNFVLGLENFKKAVETINANSDKNKDNENGVYKITYIDENGKEETKTLTKVETSKRAQLFNNEVLTLIDEYGGGITTNEKRQVLLEIIKKLQ